MRIPLLLLLLAFFTAAAFAQEDDLLDCGGDDGVAAAAAAAGWGDIERVRAAGRVLHVGVVAAAVLVAAVAVLELVGRGAPAALGAVHIP